MTQVVIGTGRPIAMRTPNGFTNLTARPLSDDQLKAFLRHPALLPLIPRADGDSDAVDVQIGRRRAVAQIRRRGDDVVLSLTRSESAADPVATMPIARVASPADAGHTAEPSTNPAPEGTPSVRFGAAPRAPAASRPAVAPKLPAPSPPLAPPLHVDVDAPTATFDDFSLDEGIQAGVFAPTAAVSAPQVREAVPARIGGPDALDMGLSLDLEDDPSHAAPPPLATRTAFEATRPHPIIASTTANSSVPVPVVRADVARMAMPAASDTRSFAGIVLAARERGASDVHVAAARVTSIRVGGELVPLDPGAKPLTAAEAEALLLPLLDKSYQDQLHEVGYVDLAIDAPGGGRLRANISRQQQGLKGTFRLALAKPSTLEELGLPADLAKVVHHHQGLIVIAGPSGQGKTTTLAALVDLLNSSRAFHILTIEDPVEIIHERKQAVISQREAGRHTASFARGLKASLREDPDVIVIGELRDRESVEIALTAAETGHLVIATMSTPSAAKTIDRLIDMFPPEEHNQVRASIAGALRAIVAQRLLPKRGGGVIPAVELVTGVLPLAVMIREDKLYQLPNLLQRGRAFGMIRFDESLAEHVRAGRVEEEAALAAADSRKDLTAALKPAAAAPAPQSKTGALFGFGKKEPK